MSQFMLRPRKRKTWLWVILIVLTLATLGLGMMLTGPSPPRKIRIATGQEGGGYDKFGQKYQERLGKMGLEVELVNTQGSIDNLERLARGEVDIAFAQGGTFSLLDDVNKSDLRGLVAVYLEPLWIFYRGTRVVVTLPEFLGDFPVLGASAVSLGAPAPGMDPFPTIAALIAGRAFQGPTIAIGPERSGTEAVARLLLKAHGITNRNARLVNLDMAEAKQGLSDGTVDVALFVSTYRDPNIQELLARKDLRLMNCQRHDIAHSRQFPYLNTVKLSEGLLNLRENIPREEKTLLAPAAILVCREELHSRVIEQVLKAARAIHSSGSLIDPPNRFPTLEGVDVPIDDTAETYMKSGESFLTRLLPYWGVRLVLQMRIFLLPLLAIWLPFLKILPMIYNYRANSLLRRHYAALREVESALGQADNPEDLRDRLEVLEHLQKDMEGLSRKVPASFQREVYHWRAHVAMVRTEALERLSRMLENQGPAPLGQVETAKDLAPLAPAPLAPAPRDPAPRKLQPG
jgi:TRAP-type uncharacterized transport system substrate-binding protein